MNRIRISVRGAVQGVGFRPFIFRLARELSLAGWVENTAQGVCIEIEGNRAALASFQERLPTEIPPLALIHEIETSLLEPHGAAGFQIRESNATGSKTTLILPDIATCADCLNDIFEPTNRRHRYPFTNCTNCGPRFSIIEALPYDRAHTSMKRFVMCAECEREYHDPLDRRFHAQPNACPKCGPQLQFWDSLGKILAQRHQALLLAAEHIRTGKILALKGIGGFQLLVDARNEKAVARLRERKHREEKPFAVMFPSLEQALVRCEISELEKRLLTSPECPIVLLARNCRAGASPARATGAVALQLAPGNPYLGVMLPYSPLHHLLLRELNFPVVATSGNLSDEPICIDEQEALTRLRDVTDFFLMHNRPIVRHVDDSIARIVGDREMILRRARGYAPLPVSIKSANSSSESRTILALGGHLKNTVALAIGENIFVSQHIGDLETAQAHEAFRRSAVDLPRLYDARPDVIVCDLHPEYLSSKFAVEIAGSSPPVRVQHHASHVAATMAENEIAPPALGVSWDGSGFGGDGTIWGGEFLLAESDGSFKRVAHLRTFRLPGGDAAVKEPRRSALGVLFEIFGDELWNKPALLKNFSDHEISLMRRMLGNGVNSPLTSSAGRLFDAVAAFLNLRQRSSF